MKFTLSWLKDHLETSLSVAELCEAMTMAGLEVEDVANPAERLASFSVARIVSAARHPNADKLQVCQVDTKDGRKEIVCGAPNARPGLTTVYAPIGAFVPGLGVTLEARPVRGITSNGMLCSAAELELDGDSDGIMELDAAFEIGAPVAAVLGLGDPLIDFEVTPNRPDWLGVAGIARDLAAAGAGVLKTADVTPVAGTFDCPVPIAIDDEGACPLFVARVIRGVRNGPSPEWLQRRLTSIGLKPRSLLVDVTNFLCFDRARPLHVYDIARIRGPVRARLGREGESLLALDGKTYAITPDMCVIADDAGVLGLGGVMGGEHSGVRDGLTDVLIESALFDALRTFRTGRATGITSDAKYRFERGVDPGFVLDGLELATRLILEHGGGEASRVTFAGAPPPKPQAFAFDPQRVEALAGVKVAPSRVKSILESLGFDVKGGAKGMTVTAPSWRGDVSGAADIVEEIVRIEGYDRIPEAPAPRAAAGAIPPASLGESRLRVARRALAGLGYLEAVTWSFTSAAHARLFGGGDAELQLLNPIAAELDCMRPTALPNLVLAARKNAARGQGDVRLFEAGPAYRGVEAEQQIRTVAAVWRVKSARHWQGAAAPDLFDIKADLLTLLDALGAPLSSAQIAEARAPWLRPGRAGALMLGPREFATFGELHPRVLSALDAEGQFLCFEVQIDALPAPRLKPTRAKPALVMSELMPLTRDFAFVVDENVTAAQLVRAAMGADKTLISQVNLFDIYRGQGVPDGKKSLAIEVTLSPQERTLTEADIDAVRQKVIAAAGKAVGAVLRS